MFGFNILCFCYNSTIFQNEDLSTPKKTLAVQTWVTNFVGRYRDSFRQFMLPSCGLFTSIFSNNQQSYLSWEFFGKTSVVWHGSFRFQFFLISSRYWFVSLVIVTDSVGIDGIHIFQSGFRVWDPGGNHYDLRFLVYGQFQALLCIYFYLGFEDYSDFGVLYFSKTLFFVRLIIKGLEFVCQKHREFASSHDFTDDLGF